MGTLKQHKLLFGLLLAAAFGTGPVHANSFGDYLVARAAEHDGNWDLAAQKLSTVWKDTKDPEALREAFLFALGSGDIASALTLAHEIKPEMPETSIAGALLLADAVKRGDLAAAESRAYALPRHGVNVPLAALSGAWLTAAHKNSEATAISGMTVPARTGLMTSLRPATSAPALPAWCETTICAPGIRRRRKRQWTRW
jgi:hypothetical protein